MRRCSSWQLLWLVLVCCSCSWRIPAAQAQPAPRTDPTEAAALNTILGRWGKKASSEWNISGEICSGLAADKTNWDDYPNINPFIKCDCSYNNNSVCHITKLRVFKLNVVGQLPAELQNFTYMEDLYGICVTMSILDKEELSCRSMFCRDYKLNLMHD